MKILFENYVIFVPRKKNGLESLGPIYSSLKDRAITKHYLNKRNINNISSKGNYFIPNVYMNIL